MNNKTPHSEKKVGWIALLASALVIVTAILSADQFANAAPVWFGQEPTFTNQERKLKVIEEVKEHIEKETEPTAQAALLLQLQSAEIDATSEAIAETLMPTLNVIARTENAISTEKAKNYKGDKTPHLPTMVGGATIYAEATKRAKDPNYRKTPHLLLPGESGLTLPGRLPNQRKEHEFTTVWVERVDALHAILFYAGGIKDTDQGIIYWSDGLAHTDNIFIVDGMGKLTIADKQGDFLVLKAKSKDELYFDTRSLQFTTLMTGPITPMTTVWVKRTPVLLEQTPVPLRTPTAQGTPAYPAP